MVLAPNISVNQDAIKRLFSYDPETGHFTRLTGRSAGRIAQSLSTKGYVRIRIGGRWYRAHRLAWLYMTGEWPLRQVDHRNYDRSDNRWRNLREATNAQNHINSKKLTTSKSGFRGVHRHRASAKFSARIKVNGKQRHLGCFDTATEAAAAYDVAAITAHGVEFARLNGVRS